MNDTVVVMLGHKSLAGKDTVFGFAEELGFKRVAFADKLKTTCMDLFNLSHDQVFGESKDIMDKRYPNTRDNPSDSDYKPFLTPRRILQIFGQDQRSLFPNIWASYIFTTAIPALEAQGHRKIVITDFRFSNEAIAAREWASRTQNSQLSIYKVHRPGIIALSGSNDISETQLDSFKGWDGEILNDSDLATLKERTIETFSKVIDTSYLKSRDFQAVS